MPHARGSDSVMQGRERGGQVGYTLGFKSKAYAYQIFGCLVSWSINKRCFPTVRVAVRGEAHYKMHP